MKLKLQAGVVTTMHGIKGKRLNANIEVLEQEYGSLKRSKSKIREEKEILEKTNTERSKDMLCLYGLM